VDDGGGFGDVFGEIKGAGRAAARERRLARQDFTLEVGDMALMDSKNDGLKYEIEEEPFGGARIKVIGVGGGGSNAVARMMEQGLRGVEFYAMNTDLQALNACPAPNKLQLGAKMTGGLGAGANPEIGRQAALEATDRIVEILQGADMVFVTAGFGGGTGTGAAPVIASLAKELDALTIAVVTRPFAFEGRRRMKVADEGLARLASNVDTVIAIPNERLLALLPETASVVEGFRTADDILRQAVQGISDIIVTPGLINRDFSDVRATMTGMGYAMMGTAAARGENAAVEAAKAAISCPLLEDTQIAGSRSILINITGSSSLSLRQVSAACNIIRDAAEYDDVQINFGVIVDEELGDAVKITVIATGCQPDSVPVGDLRSQLAATISGPSIVVQSPQIVPPLVAAAHSYQALVPMPVAVPPPPKPELAPVEMVEAYVEPEPDPEPVLIAEAEPMLDLDDLDTPAYLRQGRLLN
jgi:cell division protein FtsZ